MSWDGTQMYMMALNVQNTGLGNIQSVAMDGTGNTALSGLTASHHDLAAIPGGFATVLWNKSGTDAPCSLVERADATGALTTVVADMGDRLHLEDLPHQLGPLLPDATTRTPSAIATRAST